MTKTFAALSMLIGLGLLALIAVGCGPDQELGGTPVPNLQPNTELTAGPPDLLESSFVVSFNWTGFDPDGRVRGFQWKLSNNGNDGISVQDTLTFDPVSGDTLNPWHFTAGTDTTLLVSADLDSFPRDPVGYNRSFQTHSFFVRTIDEDGAVDSTPAYVSFNATTLLPTVEVVGPTAVIGQTSAARVPPSAAFLYGGTDPDFGFGLPTKIRFLWKRALLGDGDSEHYVNSKVEVEENMGYLVSFDDSSWSEWQGFAQQEINRRVTYDNQPKVDNLGRRIYYLFATQVQDTAGAVSIDRSYGANVIHVWIVATAPALVVFENFLGMQATTGLNLVTSLDIASGQELNFSWGATAASYAGIIESYRYGWDVLDPNDPGDAGWALAPGNSPQHRRSPTMSFSSGVHTLTIEVLDNSGQMTRVVYRFSVVQAPPPADQLPLLWVDDVFDRQSNGWVGPLPDRLPLDNDIYRDQFYLGALTGSGGVVNFDIGRDIVDIEADDFNYRRIVSYRAVLWNGRLTTQSYVYRNLAMYTNPNAPEYYVDRYNWLAAYQQRIGNLLFCSTRAMNSFLPEPPASGWALPIVFQSHEGSSRGGLEGTEYAVGFGSRTLPDGTSEWIGETRYPYVTWGISVLDEVSPNSMYVIYGSSPLTQARTGRKPMCAGVKGVSLDGDFAERHMPAGAPFDETIFTDTTIDHLDVPGASYPSYYDNLQNTYSWGDEEFYDQVIADRTTPWQRQNCANSPEGGLCLEPMFRAVARYNWIRTQHLPKPDTYTNSTAAAIPDGPSSACFSTPVSIPDNNLVGITRTVTQQATPRPLKVRVRVNITHPNVDDLRIVLTSPGNPGIRIVLKEPGGGGGGQNLVGWYPDDFEPVDSLDLLSGQNVGGIWRLRVVDTAALNVGTLNGFCVEFDGAGQAFTVAEHGSLEDLRVKVNIAHANVSDLRLELTSPSGTQILLKDYGTGGSNLVGWYPTDLTPVESLTSLIGEEVSGTWLLGIWDNHTPVSGTTNRLDLELRYEDTWPVGYYTVPMSTLCGRMALTPDDQSAKTNDVVVGLMSYKTAQDKPSQVGDILWGFDPYRYDHVQMTEVIRWVLGEHFNLPMRP